MIENPLDYDYSFAAAVFDKVPFHIFHVYYILLGCAGG
jgi:hypothetical protein